VASEGLRTSRGKSDRSWCLLSGGGRRGCGAGVGLGCGMWDSCGCGSCSAGLAGLAVVAGRWIGRYLDTAAGSVVYCGNYLRGSAACH
jgi:hypothetical protein